MMNLPRERKPGVLFGELRTRRHGETLERTVHSLLDDIDGGWQSVTQNDQKQ